MFSSQGSVPSITDSFLRDLEIFVADEATDVNNESIIDDITLNDFDTIGSNDNGRKQIARCIITFFVEEADPKFLIPDTWFDSSSISIWCGQFEKGGHTDKLHGHVYVEFLHEKRPRWSTLRKRIMEVTGSNGDIKTPRKASKNQRACAVNYVLKPDTRVNDIESYIWPYNKVKVAFDDELYNARKSKPKKSKDDVVKEQIDHIESKPKSWTWDQILHESAESKLLLATCSWGPKYHAGRHAETPRRTIQNIIVMYGAGGTGKTTLAHKWDVKENEDHSERYYARNPDDGNFWGGGRTAYRGQRIIHYEEFSGQEAFHKVKQVCDIGKYGPSVNIKQSGIELNHDTVIFTSNHHPAAWYRHLWGRESKQFMPFWRRVTQVWFFPEKRQDGSLNIPDENNPPYFIDQTDEWFNMKGDYDICLQHASEHWEVPDSGPVSDTFNTTEDKRSEFEKYCATGRINSRNN